MPQDDELMVNPRINACADGIEDASSRSAMG
ncbi:MAG: hypothetical protein ACI9ZH_002158, partial [Paracoccaceae bacterium]